MPQDVPLDVDAGSDLAERESRRPVSRNTQRSVTNRTSLPRVAAALDR